jgi:hypothetical protein
MVEADTVTILSPEDSAMVTPQGAPFLFSFISAPEPPELSDEYRGESALVDRHRHSGSAL